MKKSFFISLVLILCLYSPLRSGTIYTIGSDPGDDYASWAAFIAAVTPSPGDAASFRKGDTFNESISLSQSGSSEASISITTHGAGARPIIAPGGGNTAVTITSTGWVDIDGLELSEGLRGIAISSSVNGGDFNFSDLYIHDQTQEGIYSLNKDDVTLTSITIKDTGYDGIVNQMSPAPTTWSEINTDGWTGDRVTITGAGKNGWFNIGNNLTMESCYLSGNGTTVPGTYYHNLYLLGSGFYLHDNQLLNSPYGDGIRMAGGTGTISWNTIEGNGRHGIVMGSGGDVQFSNIYIYYNLIVLANDNGEVPYGITINDVADGVSPTYTNVKVWNNTIIGQATTANGIGLDDCSNVSIFNNLVTWEAAYQPGGRVVRFNDSDAESGATVNNNLAYGESATQAYRTGGAYADWSGWQTAGYDANGVHSNPLLQGAMPTFDSPAKNAGSNSVWSGTASIHDNDNRPITDASGNVVASGDTVDIGAFEFFVSTMRGVVPSGVSMD